MDGGNDNNLDLKVRGSKPRSVGSGDSKSSRKSNISQSTTYKELIDNITADDPVDVKAAAIYQCLSLKSKNSGKEEGLTQDDVLKKIFSESAQVLDVKRMTEANAIVTEGLNVEPAVLKEALTYFPPMNAGRMNTALNDQIKKFETSTQSKFAFEETKGMNECFLAFAAKRQECIKKREKNIKLALDLLGANVLFSNSPDVEDPAKTLRIRFVDRVEKIENFLKAHGGKQVAELIVFSDLLALNAAENPLAFVLPCYEDTTGWQGPKLGDHNDLIVLLLNKNKSDMAEALYTQRSGHIRGKDLIDAIGIKDKDFVNFLIKMVVSAEEQGANYELLREKSESPVKWVFRVNKAGNNLVCEVTKEEFAIAIAKGKASLETLFETAVINAKRQQLTNALDSSAALELLLSNDPNLVHPQNENTVFHCIALGENKFDISNEMLDLILAKISPFTQNKEKKTVVEILQEKNPDLLEKLLSYFAKETLGQEGTGRYDKNAGEYCFFKDGTTLKLNTDDLQKYWDDHASFINAFEAKEIANKKEKEEAEKKIQGDQALEKLRTALEDYFQIANISVEMMKYLPDYESKNVTVEVNALADQALILAMLSFICSKNKSGAAITVSYDEINAYNAPEEKLSSFLQYCFKNGKLEAAEGLIEKLDRQLLQNLEIYELPLLSVAIGASPTKERTGEKNKVVRNAVPMVKALAAKGLLPIDNSSLFAAEKIRREDGKKEMLEFVAGYHTLKNMIDVKKRFFKQGIHATFDEVMKEREEELKSAISRTLLKGFRVKEENGVDVSWELLSQMGDFQTSPTFKAYVEAINASIAGLFTLRANVKSVTSNLEVLDSSHDKKPYDSKSFQLELETLACRAALSVFCVGDLQTGHKVECRDGKNIAIINVDGTNEPKLSAAILSITGGKKPQKVGNAFEINAEDFNISDILAYEVRQKAEEEEEIKRQEAERLKQEAEAKKQEAGKKIQGDQALEKEKEEKQQKDDADTVQVRTIMDHVLKDSGYTYEITPADNNQITITLTPLEGPQKPAGIGAVLNTYLALEGDERFDKATNSATCAKIGWNYDSEPSQLKPLIDKITILNNLITQLAADDTEQAQFSFEVKGGAVWCNIDFANNTPLKANFENVVKHYYAEDSSSIQPGKPVSLNAESIVEVVLNHSGETHDKLLKAIKDSSFGALAVSKYDKVSVIEAGQINVAKNLVRDLSLLSQSEFGIFHYKDGSKYKVVVATHASIPADKTLKVLEDEILNMREDFHYAITVITTEAGKWLKKEEAAIWRDSITNEYSANFRALTKTPLAVQNIQFNYQPEKDTLYTAFARLAGLEYNNVQEAMEVLGRLTQEQVLDRICERFAKYAGQAGEALVKKQAWYANLSNIYGRLTFKDADREKNALEACKQIKEALHYKEGEMEFRIGGDHVFIQIPTHQKGHLEFSESFFYVLGLRSDRKIWDATPQKAEFKIDIDSLAKLGKQTGLSDTIRDKKAGLYAAFVNKEIQQYGKLTYDTTNGEMTLTKNDNGNNIFCEVLNYFIGGMEVSDGQQKYNPSFEKIDQKLQCFSKGGLGGISQMYGEELAINVAGIIAKAVECEALQQLRRAAAAQQDEKQFYLYSNITLEKDAAKFQQNALNRMYQILSEGNKTEEPKNVFAKVADQNKFQAHVPFLTKLEKEKHIISKGEAWIKAHADEAYMLAYQDTLNDIFKTYGKFAYETDGAPRKLIFAANNTYQTVNLTQIFGGELTLEKLKEKLQNFRNKPDEFLQQLHATFALAAIVNPIGQGNFLSYTQNSDAIKHNATLNQYEFQFAASGSPSVNQFETNVLNYRYQKISGEKNRLEIFKATQGGLINANLPLLAELSQKNQEKIQEQSQSGDINQALLYGYRKTLNDVFKDYGSFELNKEKNGLSFKAASEYRHNSNSVAASFGGKITLETLNGKLDGFRKANLEAFISVVQEGLKKPAQTEEIVEQVVEVDADKKESATANKGKKEKGKKEKRKDKTTASAPAVSLESILLTTESAKNTQQPAQLLEAMEHGLKPKNYGKFKELTAAKPLAAGHVKLMAEYLEAPSVEKKTMEGFKEWRKNPPKGSAISERYTINHVLKEQYDRAGSSAVPMLHQAVATGTPEQFQALLNAANKSYVLKDAVTVEGKRLPAGSTVLHAAILFGPAKKVEACLKTSKIDVNARDAEGNTPLHIALSVGNNPEIVKLLLNKTGINLNIRNNNDQTPIAIALTLPDEKTKTKTVEKLLDKGADARGVLTVKEIDEIDEAEEMARLIKRKEVSLRNKGKTEADISKEVGEYRNDQNGLLKDLKKWEEEHLNYGRRGPGRKLAAEEKLKAKEGKLKDEIEEKRKELRGKQGDRKKNAKKRETSDIKFRLAIGNDAKERLPRDFSTLVEDKFGGEDEDKDKVKDKVTKLLQDKLDSAYKNRIDTDQKLAYEFKLAKEKNVSLMTRSASEGDLRTYNRLHKLAKEGKIQTDMADNEQMAHLKIAIEKGQHNIIESILARNPERFLNSHFGENGHTPLHHAIECASSETIKLLINKGAKVGALATRQWKALEKEMALQEGSAGKYFRHSDYGYLPKYRNTPDKENRYIKESENNYVLKYVMRRVKDGYQKDRNGKFLLSPHDSYNPQYNENGKIETYVQIEREQNSAEDKTYSGIKIPQLENHSPYFDDDSRIKAGVTSLDLAIQKERGKDIISYLEKHYVKETQGKLRKDEYLGVNERLRDSGQLKDGKLEKYIEKRDVEREKISSARREAETKAAERRVIAERYKEERVKEKKEKREKKKEKKEKKETVFLNGSEMSSERGDGTSSNQGGVVFGEGNMLTTAEKESLEKPGYLKALLGGSEVMPVMRSVALNELAEEELVSLLYKAFDADYDAGLGGAKIKKGQSVIEALEESEGQSPFVLSIKDAYNALVKQKDSQEYLSLKEERTLGALLTQIKGEKEPNQMIINALQAKAETYKPLLTKKYKNGGDKNKTIVEIAKERGKEAFVVAFNKILGQDSDTPSPTRVDNSQIVGSVAETLTTAEMKKLEYTGFLDNALNPLLNDITKTQLFEGEKAFATPDGIKMLYKKFNQKRPAAEFGSKKIEEGQSLIDVLKSDDRTPKLIAAIEKVYREQVLDKQLTPPL